MHHPSITMNPVPASASASQSPRLTLPSLSPLALNDGSISQQQRAGDGTANAADTEPADRPLARTPRRPVNRLHGSRPDFDSSAEMAAIARLSLALDSATASSLSLALSSLPPTTGSSSASPATPVAPDPADPAAPPTLGMASNQPNSARLPTPTHQQRPLSIVNSLPPPTLPTLGPPRPPATAAPTPPQPSLPPHDPLSPLRMFTGHDDAGAFSDADTLSRDERRAARDPAPPYLDPTAHFYPELDALGNVRVTVPILPDLETRQAVVKMIQMHYVPPPAHSSSDAASAQHQQQAKVVPPGALQQGAGDWVLFGHASASSLCYVYRQGVHVVTIVLIPTAPDLTAATTTSPLPDQLIIPLSPRSPTHHSRLLTHTLARRPSSSVGHTIQVYHAIEKRLLPLVSAELEAAADVLTFVQRCAHYRSSTPKRRPSSASIRSTRSSIHVPLHAPPKYYDLSLHRAAAGSPPPFESLAMRASSVRRLTVSRREAAAGDPRAVMRRTLSRRGSGRVAAVAAAVEGPLEESMDSDTPPMVSLAPAVAETVGLAHGKRKLGTGFMKRWSRVVGSSSSKHHSAWGPPSPPLYSPANAPTIPPRTSYSCSPIASHAALGAPSSRRSSASSAASGQSSPALNAVRSLASVPESPAPAPAAANLSSPSQGHAQFACTAPPPVPPKDNHHHTSSSSGGGHRLSMSPSMLFKKVKAALPTSSKVD